VGAKNISELDWSTVLSKNDCVGVLSIAVPFGALFIVKLKSDQRFNGDYTLEHSIGPRAQGESAAAQAAEVRISLWTLPP
jgi:hypothetical protein